MITEEPVITFLEVEILTPINGFILGEDQLGIGRLGAAATARQWLPYAGKAQHISVQRGANRAGIDSSIAVGTAIVRLLGAGDPATSPVRPNRQLRIRLSVEPFTVIYTGWIDSASSSYSIDRQGKRRTQVRIVAVDSIKDLANTRRQGATAPDGYETWEDRIQRYMRSFSKPAVLPVEGEPILRYSL